MMRQINSEGLILLKQLESCILNAYPDPGSELAKQCLHNNIKIADYKKYWSWRTLKGDPWTVGYGSTQINHPEICEGLIINLEQAEMYLKKDLETFYQLDHYLSEQVNENQYSALICLAYNVGLRAVRMSQTLRLINEQKSPDKEWLGFNKVNGQVSNGLINRRKAELELYHRLG